MDSLIQKTSLVIVFLCAIAALFIRFHKGEKEHTPIAFVLCMSVIRDATGYLVELPPSIDTTWLIVIAWISTWVYARVWRGTPLNDSQTAVGLACICVIAVLFVGDVIAAYLFAVVVGSLFAITSRLDKDPWTISRSTALALLAGDTAGVIFNLRTETVVLQSALQCVVVLAIQLVWLYR